jgi:uncharacterized membrane protein SirB2
MSERPEFRRSLRAAAAASATPYGYTITTWASGTLTATTIGAPHLLDVLLFVAGAVIAFVLAEGAAHGSAGALAPAPPPVVPVWAHAHLLPAGGAVVLVWAADQAIDGTAAWLTAGFLATGAYLLLGALQTTVAARRAGEV